MREGRGCVERHNPGVFKNYGGGKARGSDSGLRVGWSGRVMMEIVLGVWVRVCCREGKDGGRNRHGDYRKRPRNRQRRVVRR